VANPMCAVPTTANPSSAWEPYQPTAAMPWDLKRAVHLHRRAGFAAPWPVLQQDLADGPQLAIERVLNTSQRDPAHDPAETMSRTIGDAAAGSDNPVRLKAWWIYRMLTAADPFSERVTLMWHNHFATSNRKVQKLSLMYEQNELFRRNA